MKVVPRKWNSIAVELKVFLSSSPPVMIESDNMINLVNTNRNESNLSINIAAFPKRYKMTRIVFVPSFT